MNAHSITSNRNALGSLSLTVSYYWPSVHPALVFLPQLQQTHLTHWLYWPSCLTSHLTVPFSPDPSPCSLRATSSVSCIQFMLLSCYATNWLNRLLGCSAGSWWSYYQNGSTDSHIEDILARLQLQTGQR